ncbi:MAG TPA: diadenosine tetraphosphatase [Rhodospirillaceae bacterium]|mgnify:FL=1|nr:diadenosine tetraphosphatase [Rhodospirillaceae bacterium]
MAATQRPALDLGRLDGPVLLFGGPYSNLQSTRALRAETDRLGIPAGRVICTGDVVAYCGDPDGTLDEIIDWGCHVAMGNCEEALGEGGDDCRCGFEKGSQCDLLSVRWFAHASSRVSQSHKAWMAGLPHPITFEFGGAKFAVVHGHSRDISEWVFASTPEAEKRVALDDLGVDGVIAGHSGLPFTNVLSDGRLWHNPGVTGVPANDGTPRVWYSVLEPAPGGITIRHLALEYDYEGARASMAREALPDAYRQALKDGLWPNLDVLPTAEAALTGQALAFDPVTWALPKARVGKVA